MKADYQNILPMIDHRERLKKFLGLVALIACAVAAGTTY